MRKEPLKLDLVMGKETVFQVIWIVSIFIYLSTLKEGGDSFAPQIWWQWVILIVMAAGLFLQWFFEEYYLADLDKGIIWRCSGNRFFVDQTEAFKKENINSFVLNVSVNSKGSISYYLGFVQTDGDLVRLSDNRSSFFKSKLIAKGELLAKEFGCSFYRAENKPLQIESFGKDKLVIKESHAPAWVKAEVNWLRVIIMLFVALALIIALPVLFVVFTR